MIDIGATDFFINVPSLPRNELEIYSANLFDMWEQSVEKNLVIPDFSIYLEVEEGSIKGKGNIAATIAAIYVGVGLYGDFISGLQAIQSQVSSVSNALFLSAKSPFGCGNVKASIRKNGGALSRLHGLFDKVQRGEISSDQAMSEAVNLFGNDAELAPEFMRDLQENFEKVPPYPEQLTLIDDAFDACDVNREDRKRSDHRVPHPKPAPLSQRYRIAIWRESKKEKKNVKITKLRS